MKILYISPENTVGTLSLWKRAHAELGNHCRYITYYPSMLGYEDDIVSTLNYITPGEYPRFVIYDASENTYYDAVASEDFPWTNYGITILESLNAITNSGSN